MHNIFFKIPKNIDNKVKINFLKKISSGPGVYLYKKNQNVIYVGKASNLKARITQYFADYHTDKAATIVSQADGLELIFTLSEFDSLLLEANLIYKLQPKYNVIAKDDKSPLYIVVTKSEEMPRIIIVRKHILKNGQYDKEYIIGPFQNQQMVRNILKSIRKIIPFCLQKNRDGKPCFYAHLGLCQPCPSEISGIKDLKVRLEQIKIYKNNISRLIRILSGKINNVRHSLSSEMKNAALNEQYEQAARLRDRILSIEYLIHRNYDPMSYIGSDINFLNAGNELLDLKNILKPFFPEITDLHRIECIDISNILGSNSTASLVVLIDGRPDNSLYRKFKIRIQGQNDSASISEVISRRFKHPEWQFPDLLVVDGGKSQLGMALKTLESLSIKLPVIGLAKRFEYIVVKKDDNFMEIKLNSTDKALLTLERIRNEAHRFAVRYHRHLRKKDFLE
jgi:excinuclease ABC subunit C